MKKTLIVVVAIVLVAALAVGGTFAYLTSEDSDVNVATVGNVSIDQFEQEKVGDKIVDGFTQGKDFFPGSTLSKIVSVKNTGASDAYIRTWLAFEIGTATEAQFKEYVKLMLSEDTGDCGFAWSNGTTISINGTNYYVLCATHKDAVKPGEVIKVMDGAKLNAAATNEVVAALDGNANGAYEIFAFSQAVQTVNFDGPEQALTAAFGADHPWTGEMPVVLADDAESLTKALANGGNIILTKDVELKDAPLTIAKDTVLDLGGKTLSGIATNSSASNLIKVNKGAALTLKNGTVSFAATTPDLDWDLGFPGYANNTINLSGKLVVDGATIENKTPKGGASYAIDCYPGADLTVNSGKILGYDKVAIRTFANSKTEAINVTVNGGEVTGTRAVWIQLPSNNSAVAPYVNLTVNGGTLASNDKAAGGYDLAIYSYSYGNNADNVDIKLLGGKVDGWVAVGAGTKNGKEKVFVSPNCEIAPYYAFRYTADGTINIEVAEVATEDALVDAFLSDAEANIIYSGSEDLVIGDDIKVKGDKYISSTGADLKIEDSEITVTDGATLEFKDIVVKADSDNSSIVVEDGSTVVFGEGSELKAEGDFPTSGIVRAYSSSNVILDGAKVSEIDNQGKGVLLNISDGATLTIEEGTVISNNVVSGAGNLPYALVEVYHGTLIMNGGEISNNEFKHRGLIAVSQNSEFVMNGGKIINNKFTGTTSSTSIVYLFTSSAYFEMNGGEISGNDINGKNVFGGMTSNVTLNGGTVANNK